jgi:hypothetical protein
MFLKYIPPFRAPGILRVLASPGGGFIKIWAVSGGFDRISELNDINRWDQEIFGI